MDYKMMGGGLPETKVVDLDSFFDYLQGQTGDNSATEVYKAVAWIYRCTNLRANAIADIPYRILRGKAEAPWPLDLRRLFWITEAALMVWGAAYWLKELKGAAVPRLQWLNPSSMRVETSSKGIKYFEQTVEGKTKKWDPDRIVYYRAWNPSDDLGPGIAPAQVALGAAGLARNANKWASAFFDHGAIPAVLLTVEGRIDEAEAKRVETLWNSFVGGVQRAFRTIVLGHGLSPKIIGAAVKDVAMPALLKQVRQQICVAFGVPQTMLEDAANFATAKEHRKSFWQETVIPQAKLLQETVNSQLFEMLDPALHLEFLFESVEIMQEEERDRSEAVLRLVQAGTPLEAAFQILGIDIPEGVDITPKPISLLPSGQPLRSWREDLKLWQKKAVRYLKETGSALAPFESEIMPRVLAAGLQTRLQYCENEEEVKAAFAATFRIEEALG